MSTGNAFNKSLDTKSSLCVCVIPVPKEVFPEYVTISRNAGGSGPLKSPLPTKLLMRWEDIQADHLDVPAVMSKRHLSESTF